MIYFIKLTQKGRAKVRLRNSTFRKKSRRKKLKTQGENLDNSRAKLMDLKNFNIIFVIGKNLS